MTAKRAHPSQRDLSKSAVLGDKAFGTVEILTYIRKHGGEVVIPPKSSAKKTLGL